MDIMIEAESKKAPGAGDEYRPPSVVERYYHQYLAKDCNGKEGHNQYVYQHSNRLCVIGIHPTHSIFAEKLRITKVNFQMGKFDRSVSKMHGKRKKGAQWLEKESAICEVTCDDNSVWKVYSTVRGNLIEVNEKLKEKPELLQSQPETKGFIAIMSPKMSEADEATAHLQLVKEKIDI
eukprot:Nk52_evm43s215 gene=Nk52_evmTU43s215